jgi:hypothetical protein
MGVEKLKGSFHIGGSALCGLQCLCESSMEEQACHDISLAAVDLRVS